MKWTMDRTGLGRVFGGGSRRALAALGFAIVTSGAGAGHAQTTLVSGFGGAAGYGRNCLSPNDDGSSDPVDVSAAFPNGLHFYTASYTNLYVNTNGNVTFGAALSQYTPSAFPISSAPMIAPYWADVDIRPADASCGGFGVGTGSPGNAACLNPSSDGVWWHIEPSRFVVTWDRVGYFSCHANHLMSFQLILTDATQCGESGDFDVEFRYNRCEWIAGDASGGTDGQCAPGSTGCTPAQAGFDAGDQVHYQAIPGSLTNNIDSLLCTQSNAGEAGVWRFFIRAGTITTDAGVQSCGLGACQRTVPVCASGNPVPCVPGTPAPEQCDGMDHDCNGLPNDGNLTCGQGICLRTVPLCTGTTRNVCVPGIPQPEVCNGLDDNCNGIVDEGCHDAAVDAPADADAALDGPCVTHACLLLEGRAGPVGACACRTGVPSRGRGGFALASVVVGVAVGARRRTRRTRR